MQLAVGDAVECSIVFQVYLTQQCNILTDEHCNFTVHFPLSLIFHYPALDCKLVLLSGSILKTGNTVKLLATRKETLSHLLFRWD